MPQEGSVTQLYDAFLSEHDTARRAGVIEAAYHALAAALHCAEALGDDLRIERIRTLADRLHSRTDREPSGRRLDSMTSALGWELSVFADLVGRADAVGARLRARRVTTQQLLADSPEAASGPDGCADAV